MINPGSSYLSDIVFVVEFLNFAAYYLTYAASADVQQQHEKKKNLWEKWEEKLQDADGFQRITAYFF